MMPLRLVCKWKRREWCFHINSLSPFKCYSHTSQVRWAEINKMSKKTNFMDGSSKHGSFAYIGCLWESLLATPHKWHDHRMNKKSKNVPDFKHIDTGEELLIESDYTPALVKSKLMSIGREAFASYLVVEDAWKTFFVDPSKWFDYRKIKTNSKYPDFKHKETSQALWLDDKRAPIWVFTKLKDLRDDAFINFLTMNELWKLFFTDPSKWRDYRKSKKSNNHPDFVHKDTTEGLWIEAIGTPSWITPMLKEIPDNAFAVPLFGENSWKTLFDDPSKWSDYRITKKSSKHPDFKHRDSGEGLWLASIKTPSWVFSKLNDMGDEPFEPFKSVEEWWNVFFADPSKWVDYRKIKKDMLPDFKHKGNVKTLWINDKKTPAWVLPELKNLENENFAPLLSIEELWISFFTDPSKWLDYRTVKKNNNSPDFVHTDTAEGLWIEAKETPCWIIHMLVELPTESFASFPSQENLWITFFDNPSKWFDNRKIKKSNKYPDFKHKDNHKALWIEDSRTPAWAFSKLDNVLDEPIMPSKSIEDLWKTFFADPLKWLDYRKTKKNKKFPDFREKITHEALWIADARTPEWVLFRLNDLQDEAFTPAQPVEDLWISIFVDQSKWFDYRKTQKSNDDPDFVHKDTSEALWIEAAETPDWVTLMLHNLKNEAFSPFPNLEELWKSLLDDPSKWFDNRKMKKSNKHPDFVHKDTNQALWIDRKRNPDWILPKLNSLKFEALACEDKIRASYGAKWKAYFACPSKWVDNRTGKKNPNAPDFWHKDSKEALWIGSKWTPDWVVPSLSKVGNGL